MIDLNPLINANADTSFLQLETLVSWALEGIDIRSEAISWTYFDREEVVVASLGFLTSGILLEAGLSDL